MLSGGSAQQDQFCCFFSSCVTSEDENATKSSDSLNGILSSADIWRRGRCREAEVLSRCGERRTAGLRSFQQQQRFILIIISTQVSINDGGYTSSGRASKVRCECVPEQWQCNSVLMIWRKVFCAAGVAPGILLQACSHRAQAAGNWQVWASPTQRSSTHCTFSFTCLFKRRVILCCLEKDYLLHDVSSENSEKLRTTHSWSHLTEDVQKAEHGADFSL